MNPVRSQHSPLSEVIDDDVIDVTPVAKDALSKDSSPVCISRDSSNQFKFGQLSNVQQDVKCGDVTFTFDV